MRNPSVLLLIASLTTACAGDPVSPPAGQEFALRIGQTATLGASGVRVKFAAVTEDYRCPIDVICIIMGNARIVLELRGELGQEISAALNTDQLNPAVEFGATRVQLQGLTPGRRSDRLIDPADYEALLAWSSR